MSRIAWNGGLPGVVRTFFVMACRTNDAVLSEDCWAIAEEHRNIAATDDTNMRIRLKC